MVGKNNNTDAVGPDDTSATPDSAVVDEPILLGQINGIFGVKGWCKVFSDTEPRENILTYRRWLLRPVAAGNDAAWREVKVLDGRRQGKTIVAQLEGIDSPEAARALSGSQIGIMRSELPALAADEFYWSDLLGLTVVRVQSAVEGGSAEGTSNENAALKLGLVSRVFPTGANDVLVVVPEGMPATTKNEILIPWVTGSVILKVDLEQREIVVDWDPDY